MARKNKTYTDEFVLDALNYYRKSKKSIQYVADKFGVPPTTFRQWIGTPVKKNRKTNNLDEKDKKIAILQKKLKDAEEEAEILKKAIAIFSIPQD